MFYRCFDQTSKDYIYKQNNLVMHLRNVNDPSTNPAEWYLLPQAYTITLTPYLFQFFPLLQILTNFYCMVGNPS